MIPISFTFRHITYIRLLVRLVNLDRQVLLAYTSAFVTFNALFISFVD